MRHHSILARAATIITAAIFAAAFCGCAASEMEPQPPSPVDQAQEIEPMLSAAGFRVLPADTPTKQEQLAGLVPLKVQYYVGRTGLMHYWMADPYYCKCMYVGSEQAYQKYEQYKLNAKFQAQQSEITQEQLATQQQLDMDEQMEMFNPYGMGYIGPGYVW